MQQESEATFTPNFMRDHLKVMADMGMSEQAAESSAMFAGLIATMNMLQPEGYAETFPAFTFKPIKE